MSYLLDRKLKRRKIFILVLGVILFVLIFYFRIPVFKGLSLAVTEVFGPVLKAGDSLGEKFGNLGAYFVSKRSLSRENELLLTKITENEARMLNHQLLESENSALKEIFERQREPEQAVLAVIVSKPNQSAYDTILIDAGSEAGLQTGDMVFTMGDIPLGRVGDITPKFSKVVLFSSSGERTQAFIFKIADQENAASNILYELVGRGGGNFEMILPREINLEKGDQAILPGIYPYVLAVAETTVSDLRDAFTKVLFTSPVNIQEIKFVQVKK